MKRKGNKMKGKKRKERKERKGEGKRKGVKIFTNTYKKYLQKCRMPHQL
jgi:hypothetical protein